MCLIFLQEILNDRSRGYRALKFKKKTSHFRRSVHLIPFGTNIFNFFHYNPLGIIFFSSEIKVGKTKRKIRKEIRANVSA